LGFGLVLGFGFTQDKIQLTFYAFYFEFLLFLLFLTPPTSKFNLNLHPKIQASPKKLNYI
jgi:hypothetical protein